MNLALIFTQYLRINHSTGIPISSHGIALITNVITAPKLSIITRPASLSARATGAKNGEVVQHGRDSENKTNQVVDTDARVKNLT